MDCNLPGSSVHQISQARILEWIAISFSTGSSRLRDWTQVSCTAGRRFTDWATREGPSVCVYVYRYIHFSKPLNRSLVEEEAIYECELVIFAYFLFIWSILAFTQQFHFNNGFSSALRALFRALAAANRTAHQSLKWKNLIRKILWHCFN